MRFLAFLALLSSPAKAFITVNEGLATTKGAVFVATTTPQLLLNTTFYNGLISSVSLKTSSNVVVGNDACVIYSSGSLVCQSISAPSIVASSYVVTVNGSMIGDGTSAHPIGVKSSSVAVLSGSGFVLNNQIDSSSVTKVIGITSSTASGFYLDGATYKNGVATGGTFVAAGGASSLFWQTIATGTFSARTAYNISSSDLINSGSITSSATYRVSLSVVAVSLGFPNITFNADTASNYYVYNGGKNYLNNTIGYSANAGSIALSPNIGSPNLTPGQGANFVFTISTVFGFPNTANLIGNVSGVFDGAGTVPEGGWVAGYYAGSANLSSIQINCTASCSAHFVLEKFIETW